MRRVNWAPALFAMLLMFQVMAATALPQQPPPPTLPEKIEEGQSGQAKTVDRTVYIPFENLTDVYERPESRLIIPYEEYQKLLNSWKSRQSSANTPEAVISRSSYEFNIKGDVAHIQARLSVTVLRDQPTSVPLHFGAAAIGSLTAPAQVYLQAVGPGNYHLHFPKAGEYAVTLEIALPVEVKGQSHQVELECPPVSMTELTVTLPEKGQQIKVQPAGLENAPADGQKEKKTDDATRYHAQLGATDRISLSWAAKASQSPQMEALARVENQTLVTLSNGFMHEESILAYELLRGELHQCRVVLPKSSRILNAFSSRGDSGWKSEIKGDNQIVTIDLLEPVKDRVQVTVQTERKLDGEPFSVIGIEKNGTSHGIHALDVARESGQLAIRHAPELAVTIAEQQGVVRIENSAALSHLAGDNDMLFNYYSPQVVLSLNAKPVAPRITVFSDFRFVFREEELECISHLKYRIEQAGVFQLQLQLPEGLIVDDVECSRMKEFNVDAETQRLTVALLERVEGDLQLNLKSHFKLAEGNAANLNLPIPEPMRVDREVGRLTIFARPALEVQVTPADVKSAQPVPLNGQGTQLDLVPRSSWSFHRRPVVLPVHLVRKPTRLSAQVGTVIDVQPQQIHVRSIVDFQVEYAGQDTFRIEVPAEISERLQIRLEPGDATSAPIKQTSAGEPQNSRVVWTILTQRDVVGRQRFVLTYDLTPPAADATDKPTGKQAVKPVADAAQTMQITFPRPLGLLSEQQAEQTPLVSLRGEVAISKDRMLSIQAQPQGSQLEQIDVRELQLLPADGTLAFRYFKDDTDNPVTLSVTSRRFEIQEVVSTVVQRQLVEVVASEDQAATYRCRMLLKSSERQRLLMAFPKDLEILSASLNGRDIKLEKADVALPKGLPETLAPFLVNVARPESSETAFLLTFEFLWNLNAGANADLLDESRLQLPLPTIAHGEQNVVQELKVVVWMPKDYALVGDPEPFLLKKRRGTWAFLFGTPADHDTSGLQQWTTAGAPGAVSPAPLPTGERVPYLYETLGGRSQITLRIWNKLMMTLLISISLGLIGWILLGTSWENKLGILLLMAFAATLYGMSDSHGLSQGMHAARAGLVIMLGMWVLRCLLGSPSKSRPLAKRSGKGGTYASPPIPYAVIPPPGVFEHLQPRPDGLQS